MPFLRGGIVGDSLPKRNKIKAQIIPNEEILMKEIRQSETATIIGPIILKMTLPEVPPIR
ncbi:MAG: hypothetical protein H6Q39_1760 [Chloroflexi bacterium]|nr:hypothetical protein [Chloroflexota bacterium]